MVFPYMLLLLIRHVCTDGTPDQPDTRITAKTGENVTLRCKMNLTSDIKTIFWIRMKQPEELEYVLGTFKHSTTFAQYDGLSEQRFKAINNNGTYHLQIYNLQDSDSGIYYCGYCSTLVVKFGSGTPLNKEESESRLQDSTGNTTACDIFSEKETLIGYVVGLGVVLSVCVAVMIFLIVSRLRRPVCEHCKESAQNQTLHCNNSVVEETRESDAERMNYAALDFSKRKHKGTKNKELNHPEVVYSDVKRERKQRLKTGNSCTETFHHDQMFY
ncbi:T-cell surface glycoprotein CD8 beta chain-like [Sardina pilchardus]|uniref:T-cell surface glycoprotein CD8 beta chain-like n=1 Tax=Sardina pilchardus TaxID=27697 RepID=UPI002E0F6B18